MLLITNFQDFPARWESSSGVTGASLYADNAAEFLRSAGAPDAVFLVNCSPRLTWEIAARQLLSFRRRPLVSVDLVLRRPRTLPARLALGPKRFLFGRVDRFIHYFRDVRGLDEVYGIDAGRSSFVPFKTNIWDLRSPAPAPDGEYVLCFGRSVRDFDTFFEAMATLPFPGAIVDPRQASVWEHGSRFTRRLEDLPPNVRVLEHDLSPRSQAQVLAGAKIVVMPILKGTIVSAGISTGLNAMAMGKCVIASAGPGVSDIFREELLSVPPEDPRALADRIREAWEDDDLRARTAAAAHNYAAQCGNTQDFYRRVIDDLAAWYRDSLWSRMPAR